MKLSDVVPWGRSCAEYVDMFCLTGDDFRKSILGCGDGPASFNAEMTRKGGSVVSVDPIYAFGSEQLSARIEETYDEIMPQMERNRENYVWTSIASLEELGMVRMAAMRNFLFDYEAGKSQGRYVAASLPSLPFEDGQFELALCSHFLFLYSTHVDLRQHVDSLVELTRVARETRVYPLVTLGGRKSPHLDAVVRHLAGLGCRLRVRDSRYRFQKDATQMLVVESPGYSHHGGA